MALRTNQRYGWIPSLPDQRDKRFSFPTPSALPNRVDLRSQCPPVYDQGQLGSCTANAIAAAIEFEQMRQGLSAITPSRLFIYWNEREMEGTVDSDSGAQIRDGIKSVNAQGVCPESEWPYDVSRFTVQPLRQDYTDALQNRALNYGALNQDTLSLRACLAAGFPFVFGFSVYQSFESAPVADSGIVPMPQPGESVIGGHAVVAVGYDITVNRFIVRNSWGSGWGQSGYFEMPFAYLTDPGLASDIWNIQLVGGGSPSPTPPSGCLPFFLAPLFR